MFFFSACSNCLLRGHVKFLMMMQGSQNHKKNLSNHRLRKWVSLLMLVAQTVSVVFAMRLSRTLAVEGAWFLKGNIQLLVDSNWLWFKMFQPHIDWTGYFRCMQTRWNLELMEKSTELTRNYWHCRYLEGCRFRFLQSVLTKYDQIAAGCQTCPVF